ncbi:hypothetical protein EMIT0P74_220077 [Pseudomonas sp. IT-P74]
MMNAARFLSPIGASVEAVTRSAILSDNDFMIAPRETRFLICFSPHFLWSLVGADVLLQPISFNWSFQAYRINHEPASW